MRIELKKTEPGRKTEEGLTSANNRHRFYAVRESEWPPCDYLAPERKSKKTGH